MKRISQIILLVAAALGAFSFGVLAAGDLDPTFGAGITGTTLGTLYAVEEQADGKLLVGGIFSSCNVMAAPGLTRLNSDGSVDPSFHTPNLFPALGVGAWVTSIAIQPDGKIVVGGLFSSSLGPEPGVRRLNPDGSLDTGFNVLIVTSGGWIHDVSLQPDGKILVGGSFSGAGLPENLLRLQSNGTVDGTFASGPGVVVRDLEVQTDGKIVIGGHLSSDINTGIVRRLMGDGAVDSSFVSPTVTARIEAVKVQAGGSVLIGGLFSFVNGVHRPRLALLKVDGSIEPMFNIGGSGVDFRPGTWISDIEATPDGKFLISGFFHQYNSVTRYQLARLNANGTLDSTFRDPTDLLQGASAAFDVEVLSSGKVVTALQGGTYPRAIARFNSDGTVDAGFLPLFSLDGRVQEILHQPDGKILIGGNFRSIDGVRRNGLARLNSNGALDPTFVPFFNMDDARVTAAIALQPDGRILVGFEGPFFEPVRLHPSGALDPSYQEDSAVSETHDIVVLPTGQILIAGPGYGIRRGNSNGQVDNTFNASVLGVKKIIVQPDGKYLIAGSFTQVAGTPRGRIARLNPATGSLDTSFNPPGGANGPIEDIDLQSDGKVVLGGDFTSLNGESRLRVGRLMADGTLDASFSQTADGIVRAVKLQPDGKVLIAGSMGFVQSESRVGIARLNANGSLDTSFTGRPNTSVYDVQLQPDNKILIAGEFILVNGLSALRVARLLNSAVPTSELFDYDGDGRADVSVFRPSENKWYVLRSSDGQVYQPIFAIAGDVPVPADYDGDGKTDVAIFRPSAGDWWYLASTDGSQRTFHWGASGDVPRPSDFDGDGKADFIIFRPSENNWYRYGSTGAVSIVNFGLASDKPVTGDFDGDGKSDPAIFRPSTGDWWYRSSISGGQLAAHWGISTDTPTPADFDGDGKTDLAVYRASTRVWYILNSSTGQPTITMFGLEEDRPVAADYDGDGRADIAVFRPSTGIWYLLRSTAGFSAVQFGVSADIPTPNAFVP